MEFLAANLTPFKHQNQKILEKPPIKNKILFANTKFNICLVGKILVGGVGGRGRERKEEVSISGFRKL